LEPTRQWLNVASAVIGIQNGATRTWRRCRS